MDLEPANLRKEVSRVLNQADFSVSTYTGLVESSFRIMMKPAESRKTLAVRDNLNFWIEIFRFVPRLPYKTEHEVIWLRKIIERLDEELVELDFSALINYLAQIEKSLGGELVSKS